MPFQSEKQRRFLHANHPEIAKRWEREYSNGGILDITGDEEITTEEGNDISLVDESETGVSTLFMKKGGQAIGGGTIKGEPRGDRTGFRNPHGGGGQYGGGTSGGSNQGGDDKSYQDRIQTIAQNQPATTYSNPNEDRAREEKQIAQQKAEEARDRLRGEGKYVDPILDMVGKKVVTDPSTGGRIVVDDQAVFMPERKLVDNKFAKTRPAKWVSLEEKIKWDRIDNVAEEIRDSKSYKMEKKIGNKMIDMAIAAVGIPGLGVVLGLLGLKPNVIPKRNIAGDIMEDQITGADLGWFQDTDWEGVDPEFEQDWSEFWKKGPDEDGGPGPISPLPVGGEEETDEYAQTDYGNTMWRDNQALYAQLSKKWEQEKADRDAQYAELTRENPIGTETEIIALRNSGGLANLFRVKNQ